MALLPDEATAADIPVVVPDAGPWITLAYADALDLLALLGWPVRALRCYRVAIKNTAIRAQDESPLFLHLL